MKNIIISLLALVTVAVITIYAGISHAKGNLGGYYTALGIMFFLILYGQFRQSQRIKKLTAENTSLRAELGNSSSTEE